MDFWFLIIYKLVNTSSLTSFLVLGYITNLLNCIHVSFTCVLSLCLRIHGQTRGRHVRRQEMKNFFLSLFLMTAADDHSWISCQVALTAVKTLWICVCTHAHYANTSNGTQLLVPEQQHFLFVACYLFYNSCIWYHLSLVFLKYCLIHSINNE